MLGSTLGGASAAGTIGIMGGTAGFLGTAAAVVLAPVTIIVASAAAVGVAAFEGACYYAVERVDDPKVIDQVVMDLVANGDQDYVRRERSNGEDVIVIAIKTDEQGRPKKYGKYAVNNLYIEEGLLKHRDFGPNTIIGRVGFVTASASD